MFAARVGLLFSNLAAILLNCSPMEKLQIDAYSQAEIDFELTDGQTGPNRDDAYAEFTRIGEKAREQYDCDIDVRYGPEERQRLDIFRVANNPEAAPTMIFFHGGGWRVSDKAFANFYADTYLPEGINFVAVAYSFAPEFKVGQIIEQARDAVAWVYGNAAKYQLGNERFIISGNSAGAHLGVNALLTDWSQRSVPLKVFKCGLFFSGIYDLLWNQRSTAYANLELTEAEAAAWSPLKHVMPNLPPSVFLYGEAETTLFRQMSIELSQAWERAGNESLLIGVPDGNHFSTQLIMAQKYQPQVYASCMAFIKKFL